MAEPDGEERESAIASGWTVHADPLPAADHAPAADDTPSEAAGSGIDDGSVDAADSEADAPPAQLSNAALVLLGVFGGLYLLYAWIWLSWAQFYAGQNASVAESSGSLGAVLQQIVFWAAPLAPILWFAAAMVLCRGAGMRRLTIWIVIGAVVLLPLPVFGGGA
ncbi:MULTISPECIES: hypothetical protein [unclassified Leucobacter]|uniref:hypothetical protein n=1 Tax=unclassified Leucobacter TaxID=2621730 RepID=UPI00301B43E0